jgi:hypothetical protein
MDLVTLILAALVVALVAFVLTRSNTFRVTRRTKVKASCETVRALVDDFRSWAQWSPWEKLDPDMEKTFEGPHEGVGAIYRWSGKGKVGKGCMRIVEATPTVTIIRVEFLKPFPVEYMSEFLFEPDDGGCEVTWVVYGENTVVSKLTSLFTSMDKMVGPDFETGLANLKRLAEGGKA